MDNSRYEVSTYKCSECGKEFTILQGCLTSWKYRVSLKGRTLTQCSYTCYDHALLKREGPKKYPAGKYRSFVEKSENMMKSQGKKILHPITYQGKKK